MQFTSTQKRTATWCLITLLVVLALWQLGRVLTPFVVAAVLAYALAPGVNTLVRRGVPREAARDFLLGHMNVLGAVIFKETEGVFSDGCNKAIPLYFSDKHSNKSLLKIGSRSQQRVEKAPRHLKIVFVSICWITGVHSHD